MAWHCDYESLGPFCVPDRWRAVRDSHFLSVHVNLTPDGGSLQTLPWQWLSYLHYLCISVFGIFGMAHACLVVASTPCFRWFAERRSKAPGVGNVFSNVLLHSVTEGAPRTSYVVRLVKRGCVRVTRESVLEGVRRSSACAIFERLLSLFEPSAPDGGLAADDIDWARTLRPDHRRDADESSTCLPT